MYYITWFDNHYKETGKEEYEDYEEAERRYNQLVDEVSGGCFYTDKETIATFGDWED